MENPDSIKAVYVIVNAGFADEVIELMRAEGTGGATIINARGEGPAHKSFMGITVDSEREMVLSLVDRVTAGKILAVMKKQMGLKSPARGVCFSMPVEKAVGLNKDYLPSKKRDK